MEQPAPQVLIVSPALAGANNGNWHTAARWHRFVRPLARSAVVPAWQPGEPADALIALHARRSAASIAGFRAAHPERPIAVVLTGTDLYRDLEFDHDAQHALQCASHVVVLQDQGLRRLEPQALARARVIVQSASAPAPARTARPAAAGDGTRLIAVGHLRAEKDPATLLAAVRLLPAGSAIRLVHIGAALDPALGAQAEQAQHDCACYRWLGAQPHSVVRRRIAGAAALVHTSRIEGGANVVIEAVRSGVPVLASRIDGNCGLLGADYAGYFEVGDAAGLAGLMQRFSAEPGFAERLREQCALRAPRFAPAIERAAVRGLLRDMLGWRPAEKTIGGPLLTKDSAR